MSTIVGYIVGQVGQLSGARFAIPESGLIIGRDPSHADVVVEHSLVSRRHARIAPAKDGKLYLVDLQSRNGTHVNGRKLTAPVALSAGDKIDFGGKGQAVFIYESADTTSVSGVLNQAFGETVAPVEWKPGDVIGGRFEVHGTLGKGGFGVVYLVYERDIAQMRALKTIRRELLADGEARDAFKREALLWVSLDEHPFVLSARYVDQYYGRLFVLMDYVAPDKQRRVSLSDHLAKAAGPLDLDQALRWAIQFCAGMEHAVAHGIKCHRDIKPANILITQDGTLKITDFGLAAAAEAAWRTSGRIGDSVVPDGEKDDFSFSAVQVDGMVRCGTPGYMPPEVFRGEPADIRSDIYSFGLVLWQMGTGSRIPPYVAPYRGDRGGFLREVYERQMAGRPPRINRPLWPVVKRCLRANPTKRYSDFGELRDDLTAIFRKRTGRTVSVPDAGEQKYAFWANKGASLNALGRHEDAIRCYDKALAIDPRHATIWHNKGVALYYLRRYDDAIACYDKALSIDPQYARAWNNKAMLLKTLNRNDEAMKCYDKALGIDPRFSEAWQGKGDVLCGLLRYEDAYKCFDKALAIDPLYTDCWYNKGRALRAIARHEEAIGCYDRAVAIDPRFTVAWVDKGHVLRQLGRHAEAVACWDKVLAIKPGDAGAWCDRGIDLRSLGRHEDATACYHKVLSIDPQIARAWCEKGDSLNTFACFDPIGYENALVYFKRVAFMEPGSAKGWAGMASSLVALHRREEAIACYDKMLSIDPRNADGWFPKGISLDELGRHDEAVGCFDRALAIRPRDGCIWNWKGSTLAALGRHEEAIRCYEKALSTHPIRTIPLYKKALAEDAAGMTCAAVKSYRAYIELASAEDERQIEHARRRLKELET
jgi:tetratricopeptide (TPR) repeat protein